MMKIQDPVSALTHFAGAILAVAGMISLTIKAIEINSMTYTIGFLVFGLSLILLYSASTIYHMIADPARVKKTFRRIDHMMIFVLIAGTYTPVCLIALKGTLGTIMLIVIWSVALFGIALKAFWIDAPRWLTAALYILMGWLVVFAMSPVLKSMSSAAFGWLLAGGITYTVGGLIYATKWPPFKNKWFGFHEVFHLFVLGGSACHFILVFSYL